MLRDRRLSALIVGVWLGAGVFVDVAVTQNFQTVDRFLAQPYSAAVSTELNTIGRDRERVILRRNAAEENNEIFQNWENVEFILGIGLFMVILFGAEPKKLLLAATVLMSGIVAVQHFVLSPHIVVLGRMGITNAEFWMYHGFYSGAEILKLVIGAALGARLCIGHSKEHALREHA